MNSDQFTDLVLGWIFILIAILVVMVLALLIVFLFKAVTLL